MPSPFPGMDPYLEAHWSDVHATLIVYLREQIHDQLKPPLRARVDERLVVQSEEAPDRNIYPDLRVSESTSPDFGGGGTAVLPDVVPAEPIVIVLPDENVTETYIEIVDRSAEDRLVTVIELMSPANKGTGQTAALYQRKQQEVQQAGANLVEIDLTRAGRRRFLLHSHHRRPPIAPSTFAACVFRAGHKRPQFEYYPIPLSAPIPALRVPLRPQDADVLLHVQPLLDRAYRYGSYGDIDYAREPDPGLSRAERAWAKQWMAQRQPAPPTAG